MDAMIIVLRLLHIGLGVFWAGTLIFLAVFLEPSVRAALPESGKVMQQLAQRRLLDVLPVVALLTILSGVELMRRVSSGFSAAWLGSPTGLALTLGAASALVAFVIGVLVMRPAQLKAMALGPAAQQAAGAEKDRMMAVIQGLRGRVKIAVRWVAALLAVAVAGMAVARYL